MQGETCLFELEDFETAVEDIGIAKLKRGSVKVYPKNEHSWKSRRTLASLRIRHPLISVDK